MLMLQRVMLPKNTIYTQCTVYAKDEGILGLKNILCLMLSPTCTYLPGLHLKTSILNIVAYQQLSVCAWTFTFT